MHADGSDATLLTASLDRHCAPYPDCPRAGLGRRPDRLHASRTAATSTSTPSRPTAPASRSCSSAASGRSASTTSSTASSSTPRATHTTPRELYAATDGTQLTTRRPTTFTDGRELARAGALHRGLAGRLRGRRVARPPARLRGGQELPDAAHDPRRPVLAVRHRLLRRGPGLRRRRLRRALLEPARRLGLLGGVGPRDPRPARRRRAAAGARVDYEDVMARRRHRAREVRLHRRRPARRDRRLVRRLHDVVDHRPHEPLQGGDLGARRQQPRSSMFGSSDIFWVFERQFGGADVGQHRRVPREVAGDVRAGHRDARPRRSTPRRTSAATSSRASSCSRCCA